MNFSETTGGRCPVHPENGVPCVECGVPVRDDNDWAAWAEQISKRLGWQPVETAPLDTPVLTLRQGSLMAVAEYIKPACNRHKRVWCVVDGCEILHVTHWMPLPDPPK